jgi:uncharacterized protein (TIRG00374 family)
MQVLTKKISLLIKIIFSVASILIIYNYFHVNSATLLNLKIEFKPLIIAIIFPLIINPIVSNIRWQHFLRIYEVHYPLFRLIKISFKAFFLSISLPSSLGFDAVKILLLSKEKKKDISINGISVFWDRFVALFVMLFISLVASIFIYISKGISDYFILSFVLFCLQAIFLISLKSSFYIKLMEKLFSEKSKFHRIVDSLAHLLQLIKKTDLTSILNLKSISYILLFQFSNILCTIFIFKSLDVSVPFYIHFTLLPIIWVVTIIPISISGLGLREGAFIFFYGQFGINETDAFTASILSFVLLILLPAFIGFFILLTDRNNSDKN